MKHELLFSPPPTLWQPLFLSLWAWLLLGTSYTWNDTVFILLGLAYTVFVHLCLTYFTSHVFRVHSCGVCQNFLPFKGWVRILWYGYPTFHLSVHSLVDIWVVSAFWSLVNIGVHLSDADPVFCSLMYILISGVMSGIIISGIFISILYVQFFCVNCSTVCHSSCGFLISPHPYQHFCFLDFLVLQEFLKYP